MTLLELHVGKITLTTVQKGLRQGDPSGQEPAKQTQGYLVVKVREAELESSWCSTVAMGDTAQGHYVCKEKRCFWVLLGFFWCFFFFKPGTTLINEIMHFLRNFEFLLSYISHQETNSTHSFSPSKRGVTVPQSPHL